jgi:hypothetical protein
MQEKGLLTDPFSYTFSCINSTKILDEILVQGCWPEDGVVGSQNNKRIKPREWVDCVIRLEMARKADRITTGFMT